MLRQFSYERAASVRQAVESASRPDAQVLAGGTDLLGCMRDGVIQSNRLVSLKGVAGLKGIRPTPAGGFRIGAMTTLTEVAEDSHVRESYAALAQAAASVGSPQLRNQGTLGGNLCQRPRCWYFRGDFPCRRKGGETCFAEAGDSEFHAIFGGDKCYMVCPSDTAAALVALDAKASVTGPKGARVVPLSSFFVLPAANLRKETSLAPGEIVTHILLERPQAGTRSVYRKVRERGSFDFALAGAAIVVSMSGGKVGAARIVLSGVAPVPWRSAEAEKAIVGKALDAATIEAAAKAAIEGASPLSDNGYKTLLVRGIVEEVLAGIAA
jgi:xanthine dehydrogenase YagS FAD-binding subunit